MRTFLMNLYLTMKTALVAWISGFPYWRYPLVDRINHGHEFIQRGEEMEVIGFNLVKHSLLNRYLHLLGGSFVLVTTFEDEAFVINVYRPVTKIPHLDQGRITHGSPGIDGCFHYLFRDGVLRHALRETTYTRQHAFSYQDPIFSVVLPLNTEHQQMVAHALYRDPMSSERVSRHVVREDGYTREILRLNGRMVSEMINPTLNTA